MAVFIHTSDWHIGNRFMHFDRETGEKLNRARFTAVESIFVYARKKQIPLILCAGDAVDNGQLAPEKNLLDLFAIIKRYPDITLVMIAGNHDPLMANTVYRRVTEANYPANLHLVKGNEIIPFAPLNLKIFAASTTEKNGNYNPLDWIKTEDIDETKINIALGHGSIKNEIYSPDCFPIEADFAKVKKLDYLALGDWHTYKKINPHTYYSGVPEPLQFGDDGYPLAVTIEKRGDIPRVETITGIAQYRWTQRELDISDGRFDDFRQQLESMPVEEKEIKKLSIGGYLSAENYKIYKEFLQIHRDRCYEIVDRVSLKPDTDDLSAISDGYTRELVQRLIDMKESEEPLPEEILNHVIPADQLPLEDTLKITKTEIIDNALLKLYKSLPPAGRGLF